MIKLIGLNNNENSNNILSFNKWRKLSSFFKFTIWKTINFFKKNNFKSIHFNEIDNQTSNKFIITFDDGYKDLIENALPLLNKYNFKATCLIVSNLIGKNNIWDEHNKNIKNKELMNLSEINYWLKNGMFIGSHSKNHKKLTLLDKNDAVKEIINSKDELENLTGTSINSFCYPYGLYNENIIEIVKKNDLAFTTNRSRFDTKKHDKYLLQNRYG